MGGASVHTGTLPSKTLRETALYVTGFRRRQLYGMTVRLKGSYEHRDFRDASGSRARLDDVGALSGFLDWPLGRHCKLSAGVTTERRSSTRLYQDYEYLLQQIQVTGLF